MATLPTLSNGTLCVYPLEEEIEYRTKVLQFGGGKQQRFPQIKRAKRWTIQYRGISRVDALALESFFINGKGMFATDHTLVIDGVTYNNCRLLLDELAMRETGENRWTLSLQFETNLGY